MMLLTKKHRERLLRNGRNRDQDHAPVVKFFNPSGAATWLFNELDPEDGDTLFGLADLGFGTPELGYSSLAELAAIRVRWGLGIERDRHFRAKYPMSVYTQAARAAGRIVEHGPELDAAAGVDTSPAARVASPPRGPVRAPSRHARDEAFPSRLPPVKETSHARHPHRGAHGSRRPASGPAPDGPREGREPLAQVRGAALLGHRPARHDDPRHHRRRGER